MVVGVFVIGKKRITDTPTTANVPLQSTHFHGTDF